MTVTDQKEHILRVAAELFAFQGFHGTGVRRIVSEAGVNIAMVNYYFGSKLGILQEIFNRVFAELRASIPATPPATPTPEDDNPNPDDLIRKRLGQIPLVFVRVIRRQELFFRVVIREFTLQHPGLVEMKARYISELLPLIYGPLYEGFQDGLARGEMIRIGPHQIRLDIAGPALAGMIFSHFLLSFTVPRITGLEYDEEFYDEYGKSLSQLLLTGLFGYER